MLIPTMSQIRRNAALVLFDTMRTCGGRLDVYSDFLESPSGLLVVAQRQLSSSYHGPSFQAFRAAAGWYVFNGESVAVKFTPFIMERLPNVTGLPEYTRYKTTVGQPIVAAVQDLMTLWYYRRWTGNLPAVP